MSHCCCMVFTKEFPTETVLEKILAPLNWDYVFDREYREKSYSAPFTWDYWLLGGRYSGALKLKIEEQSEKYRFYKENWYGPMAFEDGYLRIDGALCEDVVNLQEVKCFCFLDCNGNAFAREIRPGYTENTEFDKQLSSAKANSADCYVCIVDLHD